MWGRITDLKISPLRLPEDVTGLHELFLGLRHLPYAMLLLSGGSLDSSRYSLMGWDPFLVIQAKGRAVEVLIQGERRAFSANPFDLLDEVLEALTMPGQTPLLPMAAGAMGFLAYDLKNQLERLPQTAVDDLHLPDMMWAFHRRLVVHDRREQQYWQIEVEYEPPAGNIPGVKQPEIKPADLFLLASASPAGTYQVGELRSSFGQDDYLQAVSRAREYIRQGDI
jgi:para-aminobenzoate synthetase component 1